MLCRRWAAPGPGWHRPSERLRRPLPTRKTIHATTVPLPPPIGQTTRRQVSAGRSTMPITWKYIRATRSLPSWMRSRKRRSLTRPVPAKAMWEQEIGRASCRERVESGEGGEAEDGIRDGHVTGVQTCALPISLRRYLYHHLSGKLPEGRYQRAALQCQLHGSTSGRRDPYLPG